MNGPRHATLTRVARGVAATALLGIGALHAAWGAGSSWPMRDRAALSDAVMGRPGLEHGGAAASFTVAGALAASAALVAAEPRRAGGLHRTAVVGIATVLAGRGVLGVAGRTDLLVPGATGARFRRLDRRVYAPGCLVLAALCAVSSTATPASAGWAGPRDARPPS